MKVNPARMIESVMSTLVAMGIGGLTLAGFWLYGQVQEVSKTVDQDVKTALEELERTLEELEDIESRVTEAAAASMADLNEVLALGRRDRVQWLADERLNFCKASVRSPTGDPETLCNELLSSLVEGDSSVFDEQLGRAERRRLRESWLFSEFHEAMQEE